MYRGTTTQIKIVLETNLDLNKVSQIWLTFGDKENQEILNKTKNDLEIDGKIIFCNLTQKETLELNPNNEMHKPVFVQMRLLTIDDKALATPKRVLYVDNIIKEGEITNAML